LFLTIQMQTEHAVAGNRFLYKKRLEYIESKNIQELVIESENISKQLSKFINYLKKSEIY
jgi:hypothetical protein